MLLHENNFYLPERYHQALPERIRIYLRSRGLSDQIIDDNLIGWNGWRITIPILTAQRRFGFFRLAKDPEDHSDFPKMLATPGSTAELYGWDAVSARPQRIVVCEGEFDRLVLETHGIPAVSSTAGAGVFRPEWAEALAGIPEVYICFDRDPAGEAGARSVASLLPKARIVALPPEVGASGDVSDFFVRLKKNRDDFLLLLSQASPVERPLPLRKRPFSDPQVMLLRAKCELERLKQAVPISAVIGDRIILRRHGRHLVGRCPFHPDSTPSFVVFEEGQNYHCFGCRASGDALEFIKQTERLTFGQALRRLRQLAQNRYGQDAA